MTDDQQMNPTATAKGSSSFHQNYNPPEGDEHTEVTLDSTLKSSKTSDQDDFLSYFQGLPTDKRRKFLEQMQQVQEDSASAEATPAAAAP
jgi:hypothetical protein